MAKNKKTILWMAVALIVLALFFFAGGRTVFSPVVATPEETNNKDLFDERDEINPKIPGQTLPLSNTPKDEAWAVFQKYLDYNKIRDLNGVKSVVYKIAPVCEDPKTRIDCEARMNLAYQYGSVLRKEDFKNIWNDEKQTIISTDFKVEEENDLMSRNRSIVFFIRDESENLKMLNFSPFRGPIISKGTASIEELQERLIIYSQDRDEDGAPDYEEECLGVKEGEICIKTDPKIRDTDGDGWWDGVEALMID